jgi:Uma2 family endonuclease
MSAQAQPRLSPERYLEIERASALRSEYYKGRMFAMSGGTYNHARIIASITAELYTKLENGACEVVSSDLRIRVAPNGLYTYPDVVVICGEPEFVDQVGDTLANPVLMVEVLSPSTEAYDRGFKSAQYRAIRSLQEYALVAQAEPRIEVFRRQTSGDWLMSESAGLETSCQFGSIGCSLPLARIYRKIAFPGNDPSSARPSSATE